MRFKKLMSEVFDAKTYKKGDAAIIVKHEKRIEELKRQLEAAQAALRTAEKKKQEARGQHDRAFMDQMKKHPGTYNKNE